MQQWIGLFCFFRGKYVTDDIRGCNKNVWSPLLLIRLARTWTPDLRGLLNSFCCHKPQDIYSPLVEWGKYTAYLEHFRAAGRPVPVGGAKTAKTKNRNIACVVPLQRCSMTMMWQYDNDVATWQWCGSMTMMWQYDNDVAAMLFNVHHEG